MGVNKINGGKNMARAATKLTDKGIAATKGMPKVKKYFDGEGLYLQVTPKGGKSWRLKYRIDGKEKSMAIGAYPVISLKDARIKRSELRKKVAAGIDPLIEERERMEQVRLLEAQKKNTWKIVLDEYFGWVEVSGKMNGRTLVELKKKFNVETKHLDKIPFIDVSENQLRELLKKQYDRGAIDTSRRFHTQLLKLYEWARESQHIPRGVQTHPEHISKEIFLPMPQGYSKKFPVIKDPDILKALLLDIDNLKCSYPAKQALRIMPHLASRPANIRTMEWGEINFEEKLWIIPASKMKKGVSHVTPLTDFVIKVLMEMQPYSGTKTLVFPSSQSHKEMSRPMLGNCLKRTEHHYTVVPHSFRSIFSTMVRELDEDNKFPNHIIEAALAHGLSDAVEGAYNRADYLGQRKVLMQWWTDYLLELKNA